MAWLTNLPSVAYTSQAVHDTDQPGCNEYCTDFTLGHEVNIFVGVTYFDVPKIDVTGCNGGFYVMIYSKGQSFFNRGGHF